MNKIFKDKSILITGGTGSFGKAMTHKLLSTNIKEIRIFSRDEKKQDDMRKNFKDKRLKFYIGDIRDERSVEVAVENIDYIFHAAALKQVPSAEKNPFEVIKTNVIGAQNLIEASLATNVRKVIALSTDKASSPINLYGATKLCSDKLLIAANNIKGKRDISFSIVRYGNVMGSRGSVIPNFIKFKEKGFLEITDTRMTRFNITLADSIKMVEWVFNNSLGGEIFVPKIPSYKIVDLAKAICASCKIKILGIRPGEKLHEELLSSAESVNTFETKDYYIILPIVNKIYSNYFAKKTKGKRITKEFSYRSNENKFLSINDLKKLLVNY